MNQEEYLKKAEKFYDLIEKTHDQKLNFWIENVVFAWQWWFGICLTVIPWILWILFRKRESTYRLLTSGLFVMLISSWLDFIGAALGLWHYNYDVLPFLPSWLPWDLTLIPVIVMSLIQYKRITNPFLKGLIFAVGSAFIGEPFFAWIKTYSPENWKYIYSAPILFCIYLVAHYISTRDEFERVEPEINRKERN